MTKGLQYNAAILGFGIVAVLASAHAVHAQTAHPWWQPYLGCWAPAEPDPADPVLCFRAAGQGVELSTVVDGEVTSTDTLVADGVERTETVEGCTGSRSVEFSSDGRRVFTRSRITCDGQTRSSSGLMAFISPEAWVDARSIEIAGEPLALLQEYRPVGLEWFAEHGIQDPASADRRSVLAMRQWASQPIGIGDVQEALSRVAPDAVEIWVAVQPAAYGLDGRTIVRLAESGMPPSVIDVMVAVSYPERFSLTVQGVVTEPEPQPQVVRYSVRHRPVFRSPFFDPYFVWGSYRYNVFGYPVYYPYPVYGPVWYPSRRVYSRPVIVVEPRPPASRGRMVNDRGYVPRTPASRTARPAGESATISDRGYSSGAPPAARTPASTTRSSTPAAAPVTRSAPSPRGPAEARSTPPANARPSLPSSRGTATGRTARPAGGSVTISDRGRSSSPPPAARAPSSTTRSPAPAARTPVTRSAPAPRAPAEARPSTPADSRPSLPSSGGTPTGRSARPRN